MSGRRFSAAGRVLGGRVPDDVRRALPPGAASVPLIGGRPHEVRIQVITSDRAPPSVIELAAVFSGLLVRIENWTEPVEKIKSGEERQARAMGDGVATIELLELLDQTRGRILALRAAAVARAPEPLAAPVEALPPVAAPEPALTSGPEQHVAHVEHHEDSVT